MLRLITDKYEYEPTAIYDAIDGGWVLSDSVDGDLISGSGGSLELAMYSFSQAALEYEEWQTEALLQETYDRR